MHRIIDAHLDISWNALSFDRDQLLDLESLRRSESGLTGESRGNCTVCLPEMRRGNVRICLATLLCRALPDATLTSSEGLGSVGHRGHGDVILRDDLDFANRTIASATAQGQLAYYRLLEEQGHLRFVRSADELEEAWGDPGPQRPLGIILSMEGCDPIIEPSQAEWWFSQGLRTACLAHYGPSYYAMGTGGDGPITSQGRELLREFDALGMILDLVHTADTALDQAMEAFQGPVFISHGNCRTLVPHDRQISDGQIQRVASRGGVIGVVLDEWMLIPGYVRNQPGRTRARLEDVADHIEHVCGLVGDAAHVGIGSDLDGGFGREQSPEDLNSIADLQQIGQILAARGYSETDIEAVMHGNWLRFFRSSLPS